MRCSWRGAGGGAQGRLACRQVLQPEYNLYHRSAFEGALCDLASAAISGGDLLQPASGFLTGKYRQPSDLAQSQRGGKIGKYLNPRGMRIIDTWRRSRRSRGEAGGSGPRVADRPRRVTAPIASATSVAQVESFAARRR